MTITQDQLNELVATLIYSTTASLLFVWVIASFLTPIAIHFLEKRFKK